MATAAEMETLASLTSRLENFCGDLISVRHFPKGYKESCWLGWYPVTAEAGCGGSYMFCPIETGIKEADCKTETWQ